MQRGIFELFDPLLPQQSTILSNDFDDGGVFIIIVKWLGGRAFLFCFRCYFVLFFPHAFIYNNSSSS